MSWLTRLFGAEPAPPASRDPGDDYWYGPLGAPTAAGKFVTLERALTVPVVYDSVSVLAQTVATLPRGVFERMENGAKERRPDHPLASVLEDPNPEMNGCEFFEILMWDLATHGDFFAEMAPGQRGAVDTLWPLDPRNVEVERLRDRTIRYRVNEPGRQERLLLPGEVWHLRCPPLRDMLRGTSRIHVAREAIGTMLALQDYGATFFRNDATPPVALSLEHNFADADSRRNYISAIWSWWGGENRHRPAVLEWNGKIQKIGATNEEAQFLETREALNKEIARYWRMPPHKVGIMGDATFSNIEQQSLDFVTDTLLPWLKMIEKAVAKSLLIAPERFFFEFNVAGLLRGDTEMRFRAYALGRNWGWLSVNEIRALENMNGIGPDGDEYLRPLNMVPVDQPPPPPSPAPGRVPRPNGAAGPADPTVHDHEVAPWHMS